MEVPGGGRALNGLGAPPGCQNQSNSEFRCDNSVSSQTVGDKLHRQEGNSPDRRLRRLNDAK